MNRLKNISIIFLLSSFLFSFIMSCDSTDPKPVEKPPGYQEDIPWPSLADSPWPIYRGDPQNTGRSMLTGPSGNVNWKIDSLFLFSGISLDSDGNLYFVAMSRKNWEGTGSGYQGLFCYTSSGSFKWVFPLNHIEKNYHCTPIILEDGNIISSGIDNIFCIDKFGNPKWILEGLATWQSSVSVGSEGNIYFISFFPDNSLYAVSKNGDILWTDNQNIFSQATDILVHSPDGKTLYYRGNNAFLSSYELESKSLKWQSDYKIGFAPSVDNDGNVYAAGKDSNNEFWIVVFDDNGNLKWRYSLEDDQQYSYGTAIDKNGNVFVGSSTVYSFDYKGNMRWKFNIEYQTASHFTVDDLGNIYFVCDGMNSEEIILIGLNNYGELLFEKSFQVKFQKAQLPLPLNYNSELFIPTLTHNLIMSIK